MHIGIAGPILTDSLKNYIELPETYPNGLGGSNVNNMIIGLLRLGHIVSVYTLDNKVKEPIIIKGEKLKIYFGEYRERGRSRMLDFFRRESQQIRDFILMDRPEIVNAQWGYEFAIGTIKSGYPHIITLHDVPLEILKLKKDLYRFIRLLMNIWVMNKGKNFIVNSPYTAEKLKKIYKREFPFIPNSILSEWIIDKPKKFPDGKIKIVSLLSGWGKRKNPETALRAFAILRKKYGGRIEYHLFGAGYEENGYGYRWTKKNKLLDGVFFHGLVSYNQLMNLLPDYDILLHPSREESFGMTLIEAMAKGLPVIAGKNSGAVPWITDNGKKGVLIDVNRPEEILHAITTIIENKTKYEELSKNGLKWVRDNYTEIAVSQKLVNIFKGIKNQ